MLRNAPIDVLLNVVLLIIILTRAYHDNEHERHISNIYFEFVNIVTCNID